jgi:hypothetical protein
MAKKADGYSRAELIRLLLKLGMEAFERTTGISPPREA